MTRRILDLGALPWQLGRVERQPFGPQPLDDRSTVTEWLPARVPGDVRADLIAAGRIPPVETPEGIAAGAWVDDCDWWYRVTLPDCLGANEMAVLEADGIDYFSAIWLGDRRLTTHEGMFARQVVELPPWINETGPAARELAIRVWGGGALPRQPNPIWRRALRRLIATVGPSTEYFPDRLTTPKAQFSFGWDFAPRVLSTGIWDEIRLVITRGAYIEDLWVEATPLAGTVESGALGRGRAELTPPAQFVAHVRVRQRLVSFRADMIIEPERFTAAAQEQGIQPTAVHEAITDTGSAGDRPGQVALSPDRDPEFDLSLDVPSARLWWPWDQGEPYLYRATVRLLDKEGVLDEASQVVGVRSVARTASPNGTPGHFLINGRPVFLRGANWVPADILPGRVTENDYTQLLEMARATGVNFLRVWGGGIREKRAFWEQCDRLGIMAWQEFPLACTFLDHAPRDRIYLDVLAAEARGIAVALRNHPSLIAWCGGNEINPSREHLPLAAIRDALIREDPTRPWLPASPSTGDAHCWDVWHGYKSWTGLHEVTAALVSEFGLQALPGAASLAEMFPDGVPNDLSDPRWAARKAQVAKLRHYAGVDTPGMLDQFIAATQRGQAAGLQAGVEACRLRRDGTPDHPPCIGVVFWQFNEPWPAISWAVIDRAGRPKSAYDMLRHAFQPILVAARFAWRRYRPGEAFAAEVWVVNDLPRGRSGCRVEAWLDGRAVWSCAEIALPEAGARLAGRFTVTLDAVPTNLALTLTHNGDIIARNCYDLTVHLPASQPWFARVMRWLADRLLGL